MGATGLDLEGKIAAVCTPYIYLAEHDPGRVPFIHAAQVLRLKSRHFNSGIGARSFGFEADLSLFVTTTRQHGLGAMPKQINNERSRISPHLRAICVASWPEEEDNGLAMLADANICRAKQRRKSCP